MNPCPTARRRHPLCAIVVSFHCPGDELRTLLDLLVGSAEAVVLVDNTPRPDDAELLRLSRDYPSCRLIANRANLGLSVALNQGLRAAIGQGYEWAILFDQDSRPAPDMIDRLVAARDRDAGKPALGALGPVIQDGKHAASLPFFRFEPLRIQRLRPPAGAAESVEVHTLITSGCLISVRALAQVGLMDERLFIDSIDHEWCFRCRAAGYRLLGVADAVLHHRLGDALQRVPGTRWSFTVHSPFRQYHIMRNRVLLYWRSYVPLAWKLHDLRRMLFKLIVYPWLVKPRRENLSMMLKGLRDGILRR